MPVPDRGRAPLAAALALLGVLVSASPYLWSDGWQELGCAVDVAYLTNRGPRS